LAAGLALSIAIASPARAAPGIAMAWGFNHDGELGNGTTEGSDVPVAVAGLRGVRALAGGTHHSLALLDDGTVMAWGANNQGQLGDGNTESSPVPVPVSRLTEVAAIAAGEDFSLALRKDGTVMAWGKNSSGQLGNRTTTNSDVPVPVGSLTQVATIAAGDAFALALLKGGSVRAWGENAYGQLGDGTRESSAVPVAVGLPSAVTAIAAGSWHSLALLPDGTVAAWGANEAGQLGDGGEAASDMPMPVSSLGSVSRIAAGRMHSLAALSSGRVLAWGANFAGQLGDGSHAGPELCGAPALSPCSRLPVATNGVEQAAALSARGDHSMALIGDGSIMAWGNNMSGELGNGTIGPEPCANGSCSATPVAVCQEGLQIPCPDGPHLIDVRSISAGEIYSLAVVEPRLPLPELGRCVRVPGGGAYTGTSPRCVTLSSTHNGHFEWLPGRGPKAKFDDQLGELELETVRAHKLACGHGLFEGEYTGPKTAVIHQLILSGCRDLTASTSCQTNPTEEGLVTDSVPLEAALGFVRSGEKPAVGWVIEPRPPATSLVSFECGTSATAVAMAVEGAAIGRVMPLDQMVSGFELRYRQSGGKQIPESFEGGPRDILTLASTALAGATGSEQAGLQAKATRAGEEALEIKAKP
jgi:alpha-tubulin suppressor-like RCC1 family protein